MIKKLEEARILRQSLLVLAQKYRNSFEIFFFAFNATSLKPNRTLFLSF